MFGGRSANIEESEKADRGVRVHSGWNRIGEAARGRKGEVRRRWFLRRRCGRRCPQRRRDVQRRCARGGARSFDRPAVRSGRRVGCVPVGLRVAAHPAGSDRPSRSGPHDRDRAGSRARCPARRGRLRACGGTGCPRRAARRNHQARPGAQSTSAEKSAAQTPAKAGNPSGHRAQGAVRIEEKSIARSPRRRLTRPESPSSAPSPAPGVPQHRGLLRGRAGRRVSPAGWFTPSGSRRRGRSRCGGRRPSCGGSGRRRPPRWSPDRSPCPTPG